MVGLPTYTRSQLGFVNLTKNTHPCLGLGLVCEPICGGASPSLHEPGGGRAFCCNSYFSSWGCVLGLQIAEALPSGASTGPPGRGISWRRSGGGTLPMPLHQLASSRLPSSPAIPSPWPMPDHRTNKPAASGGRGAAGGDPAESFGLEEF